MNRDDLWRGLNASARGLLRTRDYSAPEIEKRLAGEGLEASSVLASRQALGETDVWIPGVELIARHVHPQRHRGSFGELGRAGEGVLGEIGLWPKQWSAARMFAGSAKGFHVHPPYVPEGESPEAWFARLYAGKDADPAHRPYDREQWDVMYLLSGRLEMILCDERAGLPRRRMRMYIDGDNHRGPNNVAVVIPAGVAHAMRGEGSEDLIMVYGTSTVFSADSEGRIASGIEQATLPAGWQDYLDSDSR